MGQIILITGGARSGKSTYAETLARALETGSMDGSGILYVATCIADDEEMKDRVRRHRDRRPESWHTLEAPEDAGRHIMETAGALPGLAGVLLDCVTLLVSQCMAHCLTNWEAITPDEADQVESAMNAEVDGLVAMAAPSVVRVHEAEAEAVPASVAPAAPAPAASGSGQIPTK